MRRPLCGWTLALAIAQRPCLADGRRSVPTKQQPTRSRGGASAFAVPASLFAPPVQPTAATAATVAVGGRDCRVVMRSGKRRGCSGVSRLEAKKSKVKAEEDEFR